MRRILACALLLAVPLAGAAEAKVIGQMTPALPLTQARVNSLPAAERGVWQAYLARSEAGKRLDRAALRAERSSLSGPVPKSPPQSRGGTMPLDREPAWYGSAEARAIADNIVSFQTPSGGWGKNQDRTGPVRQHGQLYVIAEDLPASAAGDIQAEDRQFAFVGTIDNGATTTEMRFLARVQQAVPGVAGQPYRAAFLRGLTWLLQAQYPNGGWPQVYPLQGGYHDAITFNDDAVADVVSLLLDIGARQGNFAWFAGKDAAAARAAASRAVDMILATQQVIGGKRTGWGQQHDPLTLAPVGARNFEPVSLSSNESAALIALLMRLPAKSAAVDEAIAGGVEWLRSAALRDVAWTTDQAGEGRLLIAKPGAGPLWARFYDLRTLKPIFGDRDKWIHDDVNEISLERRNGYSWFGTGPAKVIAAYDRRK